MRLFQPYDAISSTMMIEHAESAKVADYSVQLGEFSPQRVGEGIVFDQQQGCSLRAGKQGGKSPHRVVYREGGVTQECPQH